MLTKDLIKYSKRKGKVYPKYLDATQHEIIALAANLIDIFKDAEKKTFQEVEEELEELTQNVLTQTIVVKGLIKLLWDRVVAEEIDHEGIESYRKEVFQASCKLLWESCIEYPLDLEKELYQKIESTNNHTITERLYADLPKYQVVKKFKAINEKQLIQRYNIAQIQGLLFFCRNLKITIPQNSPQELRLLFKYMRFFKLLSETKKVEDSLDLTISGPLSLFYATRKYSLQLAAFFPAIPHLSNWKVEAVIEIDKNKPLILEVEPSKKIISHYKYLSSYIPEEILSFKELFNQKTEEWEIDIAQDFIPIKGKTPCFPDYEIVHKKSKSKYYIEIFHKWHQSSLQDRLKKLEDDKNSNLILAVDNTLLKDSPISNSLKASSYFEKYGMTFSTIISTQKLIKVLTSL